MAISYKVRVCISLNASNGVEGLGTSSKSKKRKNRRKKKSSAKKQEEAGTSGEGGGGTSGRGGVSALTGGVAGRASKGYAGAHYLDYSIHVDHSGDVYAKYNGSCIDDASWTVWVPKILCTNVRESLVEQGVPNSET